MENIYTGWYHRLTYGKTNRKNVKPTGNQSHILRKKTKTGNLLFSTVILWQAPNAHKNTHKKRMKFCDQKAPTNSLGTTLPVLFFEIDPVADTVMKFCLIGAVLVTTSNRSPWGVVHCTEKQKSSDL